MSGFAILLLCLSTIAHASWNLFGKKGAEAGLSFYLIAVVASCVFYVPLLAFGRHWFDVLPASFWILVFFAGIAETFYFMGLAGAYRFCSLGLSYPLARALPVLLVPIGSFLIFHQTMSISALLGVVCVVIGMLGLLRFDQGSRHKGYMIAFALLAALGTMAYSMIDYQALQLAGEYLPDIPKLQIALFYAACQGIATIPFLAMILLKRSERQKLITTFRLYRNTAIWAGLVMAITYTLVLFSYMFVTNVSYAVAFRQLSIPIGVLFGVVFLKEPLTPRIAIANLIVLLGLILVVV
ncbi:DMT family transporter [Acinetobacter populi]|uniref:Multidrug DMT transporter permease n=1 Tax=Acinetobacter populi TaxID=1582270 RepID=A0A1Z9Z2F8_9GAMM|nr:DMT family transporter [Acinetobacter populi]OUY08650.1 hypothetical protein CAP51_03300 [Acinetobacter populi]